MKSIFLFLALLFFTNEVFSQKYMDDIANKSCDCVSKIPDNLPENEFDVKFGFCMIEASIPYKKQLLKDYKIDLDQLDELGNKFGEIIGIRMATTCPSVFSSKAMINSENQMELTSEGEIVKIEDDFYVSFSLKDDLGKIGKFYWLTNVDSELNLMYNYKSLLGSTVSITYENQEFFDPKITEYRQFSILKSIKKIN